MNEHEYVQQLLPLAGPGGLDENEQQRVHRHTRECEGCRRELESWGRMSQALGRLPQPAIPAWLVERTRLQVLQQQRAAQSRRQDDWTLAGLALFAWATGLATWYLLRVLLGPELLIMGMDILRWDAWLPASAVIAWTGTAAAAVALVNRQNQLRRTR